MSNTATGLNPYGPRFYYLHRETIKKEIATIQATPGVASPSHRTQWQLRAIASRDRNTLLPYKGKLVRFPRE